MTSGIQQALGWLVLVVVIVLSRPVPGLAEAGDPMVPYRQYQAAVKTGDFQAGVSHLLEAIELWKSRYGTDSKDYGTLLDNLAGLYREQGKFELAEQKYRQSIAVSDRVLGPDSRDAAGTLHNLALLYSSTGRIDEAEAAFKQSLAIMEDKLGPSHVDVGKVAASFGQIYMLREDFTKAEQLFKRSAKIMETAQGSDSAELGGSLNELGRVYAAQGRLVEAELLYKRSIALAEKHKDRFFGQVEKRSNNLGALYILQGRYGEALPLFKEALAGIERAKGKEHPEYGIILENLAQCHMGLLKFDEAERLYLEALAIAEKAFGAKHFNVQEPVQRLGNVYQMQKRYEKAEQFYKRALSINEDAAILNDMGVLYKRRGRLDEAARYFRRALALAEKTLSDDHHRVQTALRNNIDILEKLGRTAAAAKLRERLNRAARKGERTVALYFATNRARSGGEGSFGDGRADAISYGRALVRVPASQVASRARRLSQASGLVAEARGKLTKAADLKIVGIDRYVSRRAHAKACLEASRKAANFKGQVLVFVHGYNTDFKEAIQRSTQMAFDLEFDGVMVPFAWPSVGLPTLVSYLSDQQVAQKSVNDLVAVLDALQKELPDIKIHLVAHSMGNQVMLRALDKIARRPGGAHAKFGEVIAAHPDIATKDFDALTKGFRPIVSGTTLYVNRGDLALKLSTLLRSGEGRAGNTIRAYDGADVIDSTAMSIDNDLNHDVFVRDGVLFRDMTRLLMSGARPPDQRTAEFGEKKSASGQTYWAYDKQLDPNLAFSEVAAREQKRRKVPKTTGWNAEVRVTGD